MKKESTYRCIERLGEGAYGVVFKAKSIKNSQIVAIKVIKIETQDDGIPSTTIRQLCILKRINHPNIVKLIDVEFDNQKQISEARLIFEFVEYDLGKFMKKRKKITSFICKSIIYQILKGIEHLHQHKICHRDLKPQNILINSEIVAKIADFGLSRFFTVDNRTYSEEIMTLWYRAPQVLLGCENYDFSIDIWSIGCIFYELAQGKILFQADTEIGQIFKIFQYLGTPSVQNHPQLRKYPFFKGTFPKMKECIQEKISLLEKDGIDLLLGMIHINPRQRITISKALNHSYFDEIRK